MKALKATLIASVIGTGAWLLGLARMVWPSHPMLVVLFLTIATYVVLRRAWTQPHS